MFVFSCWPACIPVAIAVVLWMVMRNPGAITLIAIVFGCIWVMHKIYVEFGAGAADVFSIIMLIVFYASTWLVIKKFGD